MGIQAGSLLLTPWLPLAVLKHYLLGSGSHRGRGPRRCWQLHLGACSWRRGTLNLVS